MQYQRPCIFLNVDHWTITSRSVILLLGVLLVIFLVLILPQVDLLDTAFHLGTAPIVVHSIATARPFFQTLSVLVAFVLCLTGIADHRSQHRLLLIGIHKIQVFNHSFRC